MSSLFDLSGRVAVVIGATSGLGEAIALGLARHGACLVPTGRRQDRVEAVAHRIQALSGCTLCQPVDVRSRASIERLRDLVLERYGRTDILVNAAGFTFRQPTAEVRESDWSHLLDTHLTGALRACQIFYEPLKASGHGRIINIVSLGAFLAFHQVAAYCAAKAALLSLTRSLACEWARDGIRVNAIAPGIFPTDLNASLVIDTPRGQEMLMRIPLGRFGSPEELVGAAVFLASDAASYVTGHCLVVDGGYLASGVNS